MSELVFKSRQVSQYLLFDSRKCKACWECLHVCEREVISRVNLPWHKHAKFVKPKACIGCLKCVKICEHGAISRIVKVSSKPGE
jgi:2-oxoglutarate ferredoxin oxidoreductase subunit delta